MTEVLFVTNLPSPYRVDFFNEFSKFCSLTVCYERLKDRDRDIRWKANVNRNYREIYSSCMNFSNDKSIGMGIVNVIKKNSFDKLIISGYASPSVILAILFCQVKGIAYYIESDGGFNHTEMFAKRMLKTRLLVKAKGHLTTSDEHIQYLEGLGIERQRIKKYPFSSIWKRDIMDCPVNRENKLLIRDAVGISEKFMVLSVGRVVFGKGFDILIKAANLLSRDIGFYIVGGEADADLSELRKKYELNNVHFVPFKNRKELKEWYKAADIFALPTRKDVWGLVVNEAMSNGLPVVTTDKCVAGIELIRDGENGFIIPSESPNALADAIKRLFENKDIEHMGLECIKTIRKYTIETMVEAHVEFLGM